MVDIPKRTGSPVLRRNQWRSLSHTTISTSRDSNFKRSVVDFQLVDHVLSIGRIKFPLKCKQDLPKPEFRAP